MKKLILPLIALFLLAGPAVFGQQSEAYIDIVADNNLSMNGSVLVQVVAEASLAENSIDSYLALRKGISDGIAESGTNWRHNDNGLSNDDIAKMIVIFPNPVVDRFKVKVPREIGEVKWAAIFNMDGTKVRDFGSKIGGGKDREIEMDASDLMPGTYFLRIENESGIVAKSFTVQ